MRMVNASSPTTYTDEANWKACAVKDNESFCFKGELMLLITTMMHNDSMVIMTTTGPIASMLSLSLLLMLLFLLT